MISLRPLSKNNVSSFYKWINDEEVIKYSLSIFQTINTKDEIDGWFNDLINDKGILNFGIFLEENNILIGYAGICNISKINHSGEYYIFIGEKSLWGKGIGKMVSRKIVKVGFEDLNLNRIYLSVSELNIGGVKAYSEVGFKEEGKLRMACFREKKYHDKILMGIIKSEWSPF